MDTSVAAATAPAMATAAAVGSTKDRSFAGRRNQQYLLEW